MPKKHKVSIIGAGNIGSTVASLLSLDSCFELAIVDVKGDFAAGKALDISQSSGIDGFEPNIAASSDYSVIRNSDVIVVTAGLPRKPGMTRDDLIEINSGIISSVAENIKKYSKDSFVIVITNPLDAMVYLMDKLLGGASQKVVGMAGVLDSARFTYFLSQALSVSVSDIQTLVLGGHGDTMVPLVGYTSIAGIPLSHFIKSGYISEEKLSEIIVRTRNGGAEIVNLLGNGSAFYSPASSAIKMLKSYLYNECRVMPCACKLSGEYGVSGLYLGVPCIIGSNGVEKVLEISLSDSERKMLDVSIAAVKDLATIVDSKYN